MLALASGPGRLGSARGNRGCDSNPFPFVFGVLVFQLFVFAVEEGGDGWVSEWLR